MLGAFCYGGFIPWDDDIDIKMPRPDYEKLPRYQSEFPGHLKLIRPDDNDYHYTFAKLIDNRTVLVENPGTEQEYRSSVYIDILPMDGYDNRYLRKMERYKTLFHISKNGFPNDLKGKIYSLLYSPKSVYRKMTKTVQKCQYNQSEYVGLLMDGDTKKERFKKDSLDNHIFLPFEGHLFPATSDYRNHLAVFYGKHVLEHENKGNLPRYPQQHFFEAYWK